MIILPSRNSDENINVIFIPFFEKYPNIKSLLKARSTQINGFITNVKKYTNKSNWLSESANMIHSDDKIPTNINNLIKLKGVGRKSANVIIRELNNEPEDIIVGYT